MKQKEIWKAGNMLYPLPAVLVSCARPGEAPNILTVAWTGTVCTNPPMVCVSIRPGRFSYDIIRDTGEFVINLTTKKLVRAVDYCGVRSGRDADKFRELGLTPAPAQKVGVPIIEESPVNIECTVTRVIDLGSHHLFLARVEAVNVDAAYLDEKGRFDFGKAEPLVYSHGEYYALGEKLGSFGYSVRRKQKAGEGQHKTGGEQYKAGEKKRKAGEGQYKAGEKKRKAGEGQHKANEKKRKAGGAPRKTEGKQRKAGKRA